MTVFRRRVLALLLCGAFTSLALAQRVEDYRNVTINVQATEYRPTEDGGTSISACAWAAAADGGFRREYCTPAYEGRTPAQRAALASCADNGERVWALDAKIRADAGF